jgi:arginine/lysine/ornithine decarboxylase
VHWANDMKTPICDFVNKYAKKNNLRLHMPGHKGISFLGVEHLDITEIQGADSLYEASGIIAQSEANASELFGCKTYYSTEGSSQCIRAMLYLATLHAKKHGKKPIIASTRNAHKTFHSACALLDLDVEWIYPRKMDNYLSCVVDGDDIKSFLDNATCKPTAIYLTSPDYLGKMCDIESISKICKEEGILLIVDNAHGAYLKFLQKSEHPIDLGADICCDSAHKTLPVLTGGAYLHVSEYVYSELADSIKNSLALFGSTSPSYLILQSLDAANIYLEEHKKRLGDFVAQLDALKQKLIDLGYVLYEDEHIKLTVDTKSYGYLGYDFANILLEKGIVCEFSDADFVVMMLTPENSVEDLLVLESALLSIEKKDALKSRAPIFHQPARALTIREATLALSEQLSVDECEGRVAAMSTVGCPPAVPIIVSGEIIDKDIIFCMKYYGIDKCNVIK